VIASAVSLPPSAFETLLPTTLLLLAALVCAVLGWRLPALPGSVHRAIGCIGLLAAVADAVALFHGIAGPVGVGLNAFGGGVVDDRFSTYAVVLVCGVGLVATLGAGTADQRLGTRAPAHQALLLAAAAGATTLADQSEMAMLVAGLALLMPSLLGMVALEKTSDGAVRAGLRQLAGAGVALALLVYGLAMVYGATGSTDLATTRSLLPHTSGALEGLGLGLVVLGLAHLVGAPPLHHWMVQVARGSHGAVAAAVVGLSGAAGGVTMVRVMVSGFGPGLRPWVVMAAIVAAIACLYPAVVSLTSSTLRGLVGLGASLQGGLLIAALVGAGTGIDGRASGGVDALLYGLAGFAAAVLTSLLAVAILEGGGAGPQLTDLRGLARRSPLGASLLAVGLAGLGGLPPTAGFVARVLVVQSSVAAGYAWVGVAAVAASAVYAVAVLRALAAVFVEDDDAPALAPPGPRLARAAASACAGCAVAATVLAGPLVYAANSASLSLH
jgi:NADH-quinone oxidoreductase subunit N